MIGVCLDASASNGRGSQETASNLTEYVVKAGFLFNFAKYVEWPADAFEKNDTPISIGIVGMDPFGDEIDKTLSGKTVRERRFSIRRFPEMSDLRRCHILFIPRTEKARLPEILKQVESWPALIVGENEGFAKAGGMVNILIEKERPRLEVNPAAAEKAKLTINSKLLKLSAIVKTDP